MRFYKTGIYYTDIRILHCDNNIYSQEEFSNLVDKVIRYLSKSYTITMVSIDDNSTRIYYHLPD